MKFKYTAGSKSNKGQWTWAWERRDTDRTPDWLWDFFDRMNDGKQR